MAVRHDDHDTQRVERVEHVVERPVTTPSTNVNVGTTTAPIAPTAPRPVLTVTSVTTLFFTVLEVLLLLRFVFKLAGANANQALVAALYGVTEPLVRPFQGIFAEPAGPPIVDLPALLAIVFLFLVGALIVALVRAITAPREV
ncbi:MAG TPA: YggT family protein [Candidatus Limnocylindria bacterium]|nr:YggT family protein [Candidatus Limnocylindria bacterium]